MLPLNMSMPHSLIVQYARPCTRVLNLDSHNAVLHMPISKAAADMATKFIREYYSRHLVGVPGLASREFGFGDFESKIRVRHLAFGSDRDFNRYLVENAPPFVSFSSALYERPASRPMETKGLKGAELVFDLDATDMHLACQKEHGTSWVCSDCLSAVRAEAVKLIEEFLMPDFGFEENSISINFSGNRGYHVRVGNDEVLKLDGRARKQISDYISGNGMRLEALFPTIGQKGIRLEGPKPTDYGWGGKLARGTIEAVNRGRAALEELGARPEDARLMERHKAAIIMGITTGNWDMVRINKKAEFWANVMKGMTIKQSDSIDRNVTNDPSHLLRAPETLHGDTMLVSKKVPSIKELRGFEPMTDAIAFRGGTMLVKVLKAPRLNMDGKAFGPYENKEVALPTYAALYLIMKRVAEPA